MAHAVQKPGGEPRSRTFTWTWGLQRPLCRPTAGTCSSGFMTTGADFVRPKSFVAQWRLTMSPWLIGSPPLPPAHGKELRTTLYGLGNGSHRSGEWARQDGTVTSCQGLRIPFLAAMDLAARKGHLDDVRWLHEHRQDGCTTQAMDAASARDHLDIVRFLQHHRDKGCNSSCISIAAKAARQQRTRWLQRTATSRSSTGSSRINRSCSTWCRSARRLDDAMRF